MYRVISVSVRDLRAARTAQFENQCRCHEEILPRIKQLGITHWQKHRVLYVVGRAAVSYASTQSGLEAGKSEQKERSQEDTDYGQASSGKDSQGQCRFAGRRFGIRRLNTALDPKATTCRAAAHLRRWNDWNEK